MNRGCDGRWEFLFSPRAEEGVPKGGIEPQMSADGRRSIGSNPRPSALICGFNPTSVTLREIFSAMLRRGFAMKEKWGVHG